MTTNAQAPHSGSNEDLTIEQREVEGLSQGTIVRRRFFRHKGAVISLVGLSLIAILIYTSIGISVFGFVIPGWWPLNYQSTYPVVNPGGTPTWVLPFTFGAHPFGQDEIGRDIFARVMRGAQQSIVVVVVFGFVAGIIGVTIGAISGYFRGKIDAVLMRFTDMIIVIPFLLLAAVIGRTFGSLGAFVLAVALGFFGWTSLARLVRGEFLSLREREFVDAARVAGASNGHIIFRHILPNTLGVVIVTLSLTMSGAILLEAALSFLGVGIKFPDVSLGQLLNEYQGAFATRPWLFWWPGVFIILIALAINFIGDGLRDAFDPRQRRMPGTPGPYRQILAPVFGFMTGSHRGGYERGRGGDGVVRADDSTIDPTYNDSRKGRK
ncbi:MAG: ABC transporter permease [Microbacteriaceae bacterium]